MNTVEHEVDRFLTLLRNKIRERGLTQLDVQEALGWGRSYISQLLTKQKSLRVEQVLMILGVLGVAPADYFRELYQFASEYPPPAVSVGSTRVLGEGGTLAARGAEGTATDLVAAYRELSSLVQGVLRLLVEQQVIDPDQLDSAVRTSRGQLGSTPADSP